MPARAHRHRRRTGRALLTAATAALALLAFAPGALASTLTMASDGTLTYASGNTGYNDVRFVTPTAQPASTVEVITNDSDPINGASVPAQCTNNGASGTGSDYTCTGVTAVVANAGDHGSSIDASGNGPSQLPIAVPATLNGGSGSDYLGGGSGNDTLNGGAGGDYLFGGAGNDTLNGGAGNDYLDGGTGNDVLNGGAGDDTLNGDAGQSYPPAAGTTDNDVLNGNDGNDSLYPSNGTNTVSGGSGIDTVYYADNAYQPASTPGGTAAFVGTPVSVSLDGQANDGYAGNGSNVETDVEDISVYDQVDCSQIGPPTPCGYGDATLSGNDMPNSISGGSGNDTITGGGGADFLSGNAGNNTLNAVDGYPDRVDCGGTGTANVDQLDTVLSCTTVNTTPVSNTGLVTQDKAPAVAWSAPSDGAVLPFTAPTTLSVTATPGDHPITQVLFYVGERMVCDVKAAPFSCSYQPAKGDSGRQTLIAVATDSIGLTGTSSRTVTVGAPPKYDGSLGVTGSQLTVRHGRVYVKFTCKSSVACKLRFSIDIRAKLKKTKKLASVLFTQSSNGVKTIPAGKTVTVSDSVTPAGLTLLEKAKHHRLVGKLSSKPRSAQKGTVRNVTLVLK